MSEIMIILALVVANGFFSGAEIAVVTARRTRIQELADEGRGGARAVLALKGQPEKFLATVQVGITVVSATAAAFGGASLAAHLVPTISEVGWMRPHAQGFALAVVIGLVSFLSIVLGELVPKSLALRGAERYSLLVARPILLLSAIARPIAWVLNASANVILRPFGDRTNFTEARHSADELQQLVDEARHAGTIHPAAGDIAARALELPELTAADVLVPRQSVVTIPRGAGPDEVRRILLEHTHTRLPVIDGTVDNVVGYVNVKDLLAVAWEQKLIVLEDAMRAPYFVPSSKRAVDILNEMRARHVPIAVVVDEHGGMSGIVTMEDILEELVGEIFSEHSEQALHDIVVEGENTARMSGTAPIREVNRALGLDLPDEGRWTTIAGLCLAVHGGMPSTGEVVEIDGRVTVEIIEASPRRIRAVRVRSVPPSSVLSQ